MQTAYDLIWLSGERAPDHLALVDDATERRLTYRELLAEIDAVAAGLAARGVGRGTRVATVLPSLFDHCVALLALQRLAAVPALLNFRLDAGDIADLIAEGDIEGAIIPNDAGLARTLAATLPADGTLLAVGGAAGAAADFAACRGAPADLPPIPRPDPEDLAFIFYTSGTTGRPKGAMLAQRTTEHRVLWLSTQAGLRHGTHNRALGFMPLSHAIGFFGVFLATLAYGGTYYAMSSFDPAAAVDAIERHRITYLFAIPTLYRAMTAAPSYAPARLDSLELVLYGGAAIDPALMDHLAANWKARVVHIYGTTETMCSLYNPDPAEAPAKLRPGFYSRTRAVRVGGGPDELAAPGEEGELIIDATADTVFSGYLNRPDATADKVRDGWYYSGDVVRVEDDGDLTLMGRVDDVIRSGGENVHPEEVEAVLGAHPAVAECAVVGVADALWGEAVVACVAPAKGDIDVAELDAHCRSSRLAGFKRPRFYLVVDALPRNAANKVLRRALRDKAAAPDADYRPVARG